ncbi:MAG: flavin reductase [Candidimonas sp.]|nr:MAG: flavin reductase [Candidimonas sp.]
MIPQANQDAFRQAMRRLAATVTIVATGQAPNRSGLTATAVCSLTANPPQVIACLNASSSTCSLIRETGVFSVNILPSLNFA